jgi:hypothetical protein
MRIIEKLAVPIFLVAGGMAYLADEFNMPFLLPVAFSIFGLFAVALGAGTLLQGRIQLLDRLYSRREHYSGLSARLLGLIILLFGAGILLHTIVEWMNPGMANAFLVSLVDTNRGRGVLCTTFGLFILLFGLIWLISGSAHNLELRSGWVDLGFRLWGLFGVLIGILLGIVGVWWMFVP